MTKKNFSQNMPPAGGQAYQQTVEQVLAQAQSPDESPNDFGKNH
ncbi:hypothetical protein P3S19_24365 [Enterobacter hormaechei]|nr:hypothetical protein [Enterobacter hormaechei]MDF3716622.1 hypothetical protein [Enterobacter hormaechei]